MTATRSMRSLVKDYLEERRRLGFSLVHEGSLLISFARFADRMRHRGPLTSRIILLWAKDDAARAKPITWARRLEVVRPFAKYCKRIDPATQIPEAGVYGPAHRRLTPHIYTEREISELLAAAGNMAPKGTLRPAMYQTLFGLIAATGLRISEALSLRCADVDLSQGILTVRQTKFGKSRLVPLHPTVIKALAAYSAMRQRWAPMAPDRHFFVLQSGTAPANRTVHGVFQKLRLQLRWKARGSHAAPRIHDLRHSFICRRVKLWLRHGADIDHAMLALSTYVGHARVTDTYWYLTGVPDLMAIAGQRFEKFALDIGGGRRG
jgi:integrase